MRSMYCLLMTLFIAVMGSDWLLARRIRKAVALQRLHSPDLENTRFAANELSDPDHIAIRRHQRMHHVLVALLVAFFGAALLLRVAAWQLTRPEAA